MLSHEAPTTMQSLNFEFLRDKWPELADLGGLAESYAHTDAVGSIAKLRSFCEQVVEWLHFELRLPKPPRANLSDLLHNQPFLEVVDRVTLSKLHTLRTEGNKAVHGNKGDTALAVRLLQEAYHVGCWLHVSHGRGKAADCPGFAPPPAGGVEGTKQRREKRAYLEHIAAQEAQLKELLSKLEQERSRAEKAEASEKEKQAALAAALEAADSLRAVDPLSYSEADTRRYLIDRMFVDAGWDVADGTQDTEEVKKEYPVKHQPTNSGEGSADYVLFDDNGKPLAVLEAKKTAEDAQKGRTQAKHYADGIEKEHGQRPVIFYTNGYDLWIWNDEAGEPWRRLYGFYSKNSLQHLVFQRHQKKPLSEVAPNAAIAGRMYQIEAVRRVVERFAEKKRKALVVQATGTGKTRVAISLCDAMIKANWAKRILFLCDRRELRKQANKNFKQFLPSEPRTYVTAATAQDTENRIYLATYPAMMKTYESFDVGFFDLIIADESHRSLYNRYRQLFDYFDCYQVGLTATPINERTIGSYYRNTFRMFECEDQDPTAYYPYEEAINNKPPFLVPFEVEKHTTEFLRQGIKYSQMSAAQREQLEEDEPVPELIEYDQPNVDKYVYNKDTNRKILRNLMDHGIRVAEGSRLGKSIIFARSMRHARLLEELFNELYPQYGGDFCQVIVSDDPRAESLIDDFKGEGKNPDLTIAISVDMLDTGVDIPEVVNLVFAKPVYSYVKFWQMIGRGTRLCENLLGPGKDKTHFKIFDHWGNFEWFEEQHKEATPTRSKSLAERVFLSRLELASTALEQQQGDAFDLALELLAKDIANLPKGSIPVRERWRELHDVSQPETLRQFSAGTQAALTHEVAPLMQWVDIAKHSEAWKFDQLVARLQKELIQNSSKFDDLRDDAENWIRQLRINLSQVKVKQAAIDRYKSPDFWDQVTVADLEEMRREIRGIAQFRDGQQRQSIEAKIIDVAEDDAGIQRERHKVRLDKLDDLEMVAYRNRVTTVLQGIIDQNETLQKITRNEPVEPEELEQLCSLILTQEPGLDLHELEEYHQHAKPLDQAIREIIGMDAEVVHERFTDFVQKHPKLASHQIKFLDLLQNHIARHGTIEIADLYEPPFTALHDEGLDGLFEGQLADELHDIIRTFQPQAD